MSSFEQSPKIDWLEKTDIEVDPFVEMLATRQLEDANLETRIPLSEIDFGRRVSVVTEGGEFEYMAIPWTTELRPRKDVGMLCILNFSIGEVDHLPSNLFILEGMSVGAVMRPEDIGMVNKGFSLRYRPLEVAAQQTSVEYEFASPDEREAMIDEGWARSISGWPKVIVPLAPKFTQPVERLTVHGIDQTLIELI